jgi:hypothetical protein
MISESKFRAGQVVAFMLSNNETIYVRLCSPVYRSLDNRIIDSWIIPNPDIHKVGTWQVKSGDIRPLTKVERGTP